MVSTTIVQGPLSGQPKTAAMREEPLFSYTIKPPPASSVDLRAPVTNDVILEVRSGKMKLMDGINVLSGIDKTICNGRVKVASTGILGDEHDYIFHGGVDKAVHGYCCTHYADWKREFPTAAERFRPGGFGENLVFARLNERNIHIGDVYAVGPRGRGADDDEGLLLLQVSLPRQPCFKLSHRFGLKDFAPNTTRTSRTGWYYRVLREGTVQAGDEVRLIRRPQPDWPLERVQEYLHRNPNNMAMIEQLAAIDEFGDECKNAFRSRIAKQQAKARREQKKQEAAAKGGDDSEGWRSFRVVEKQALTPRVTKFVFEAITRDDDVDEDVVPSSGAHVRLRLGNDSHGSGGGGLVRSYSVVTGDPNKFELGVSYDGPASSRGGSRYLHETVHVGSIVQAGHFAAGVPMAAASRHVFVAGGIGITAFLGHLRQMHRVHLSYQLHYAVKSAAPEHLPYRDILALLGEDTTDADNSNAVVLYDSARGERMDLANIVAGLPWNARINFCGPPGMMDEAQRVVRAAGLADSDVHFEAFTADTTGDPFEVVVETGEEGSGAAGTKGQALSVGEDETLLEVLQRQFGGSAVASSCEVGNCGTCRVTVKSGRVEHRGTALSAEDKCSGMLSCVSRGIGRIVVEI